MIHELKIRNCVRFIFADTSTAQIYNSIKYQENYTEVKLLPAMSPPPLNSDLESMQLVISALWA